MNQPNIDQPFSHDCVVIHTKNGRVWQAFSCFFSCKENYSFDIHLLINRNKLIPQKMFDWSKKMNCYSFFTEKKDLIEQKKEAFNFYKQYYNNIHIINDDYLVMNNKIINNVRDENYNVVITDDWNKIKINNNLTCEAKEEKRVLFSSFKEGVGKFSINTNKDEIGCPFSYAGMFETMECTTNEKKIIESWKGASFLYQALINEN